MNKRLKRYQFAKQDLLKAFNCDEDYHLRLCVGHKWCLEENEGVYFLSYWKDAEPVTNAVVVKKDGGPLLFESRDMTMVIAIDCIKMAFILNNSERM